MQPDWKQIAVGLSPGIPAIDYLQTEIVDGTDLSHVIQTGLAAALYRLKNGSSVCLSMPVTHPNILKQVLYYLHACRIDAMHGCLRAAWFNSYNMVMLPDLLVWTRGSMQSRLLKDDQQLHVQYVGLNRETRRLKENIDDDDRIVRTIICQPADDMFGFTKQLARHMSPFAIVVDMTPFGYREDPQHIAELMEAHFPGCPMLFLGSTGDVETDKRFCELPSRYAFWRQHALDSTIIDSKAKRCKWHLDLTIVPDHRLGNRLVHAASICKNIHSTLPDVLRKDASGSLYRVLNALQVLAIPFEFYESQLNAKRRGGLFPIKPLKDWLARASRAKLPTGEAQSYMEQAIRELEDIIDLIKEGKTGKYQALIKWIDYVLNEKTSGLIIVGSQGEADIMRSWLVTQYLRAVEQQKIVVLGARSVREVYKLQGLYDHALVIGKIWPEDLWTNFAAKQVTWLGYPGELHWFKYLASRVIYAGNASSDQKAAWWRLEKLEHKPIPANEVKVSEETWSECSGEYTLTQSADFDLTQDPEWLTKLFSDIQAPVETVSHNSPLLKGEISITTESGPYRFDRNESLQVLVEYQGQSKVETVAAHEVQEGQRLILLNGEDQMEFSLLEILIDYIKEDSQEEQMYDKFAHRWFDYLDGAMRRFKSVDLLRRKLKEAGMNYQSQTIQRWISQVVIAPQKKEKVVPELAKLSGLEYTETDIRTVVKALSHVLGLHVNVGKMIKAAMLAEITGASEIRISGKVISLDDLRARYGIETVLSVYDPKDDPELVEVQTLADLLESVVSTSQGRLQCTNRAYKSAEQSPYKDLNKVEVCLNLMRDDFYHVFAEGGSLEKAIGKVRPYGIEYRGDSSAITKGQNKNVYYRTYKGKKIDIGKHLNLGDSRNPERCLRIHFHYDDDDKRIVIHHIGRHLPVANG